MSRDVSKHQIIATSKYHNIKQALTPTSPSTLHPVSAPICEEKGVQLWIKRDDQLQLGDDLGFCGNKWRKLKYNLLAAREEGHTKLLTFGGAFSNHIVATASAGRLFGFQTIGIIRGERPRTGNGSLRYAEACGMHLHFITRSAYRNKKDAEFIQNLHDQFGDFYAIPEGGSNILALKGCQELGKELLDQCGHRPLYIALACGTGGTLAGLAQAVSSEVEVLGFSALKGDFLTGEVEKLQALFPSPTAPWRIINNYHFGGFAKFTPTLIQFINTFKQQYGIALDPIYTGKLFFGLLDLIGADYFPANAHIIAVHTGGLQGIRGFNERFGALID